MTRGSPWTTEWIEGDPIEVGPRQLIPVVRVRSMVQRQVTFGTETSRGKGAGMVWLKPVAVIERRLDGSERRISIPDATGVVIQGMVVGILALSLSYLVIAGVMFLLGRRPGGITRTDGVS